MKALVAALLLLLGSGFASAQELFPLQQVQVTGGGGNCSQDPTCPAAAASYNLDPAYSDEFNGTSIDTTKWKIGPGGGGAATPSCLVYDPSVAYESGGIIHAPVTFDGSVYHVAGGVVSQHTYPFTDYYQVSRIQWTGGVGQLWAGLIQWGLGPAYGGYASTIIENDQVEGSSNNWHIFGPNFENIAGNSVQHAYPGGSPVLSGWHTFGKLKQGNTETMYYDGQVFAIVGPGSTPPTGGDAFPDDIMAGSHESFSPALYSYQAGCPNAPADLQIDLVRVYH